jgi:hypothetical protein
MTNAEYPTIQTDQLSGVPEIVTDFPVPPKKKHGKKFWILIIIAASILGCMALCVSFVVLSLVRSNTEREPILKILDSYMTNMKSKNAKEAYTLFTPRLKKKLPLKELESFTKGNNYIIFEGYQKLSIKKIVMTKAFNTNPDMPRGDVATIQAEVYYAGGIVGQMQATMEKNGDSWTIYYVNVVVPPDKMGEESPSL